MTGQTFGRLVVLNREENHVQPNGVSVVMWRCKCECGNETIVSGMSLRLGHTQSCGCYHKDCAAHSGHKNKSYNTYDLSGEYGIGYTSKGEAFYFDLEDYDKIKDYCWYINENGYVMTNEIGTRRHIRFHRLILSVGEHEEVDHIKHRNNDNRKSQLRIVSGLQNQMNKGLIKTNTSGATGVRREKRRGYWYATITVNKRVIYLGSFGNDFDAAVKARKDAEQLYHGEFSYDNSMNINE
jgi:hypothetical protein